MIKRKQKKRKENLNFFYFTSCGISSTMASIQAKDITLFFESSSGSGREENDKRNKIREKILYMTQEKECSAFYEDKEHGQAWTTLANSFQKALQEIATLEQIPAYQSMKVIPKGGRKFNYDFLLSFQTESGERNIPVEFKFGGTSISSLPEFFNPVANKPFHSESYASFFYQQYLPKIASLYDIKTPLPSEEEYLKVVYNNNAKIPFLQSLRKADKENSDKSSESKYRQKQKIVNESIKEYLNKNLDTTNFELIASELKRSQMKKRFLIYSNGKFHHDALHEDELDLEESAYIKNNNVLVVQTKQPGTEIHMLLRWKNGLGINLPAWQISLIRS